MKTVDGELGTVSEKAIEISEKKTMAEVRQICATHDGFVTSRLLPLACIVSVGAFAFLQTCCG